VFDTYLNCLYYAFVDYEKVIKESEAEIAKLLEQRQRIDARISLLKTMVQNCRQLLGVPVGQPTSRVRKRQEIESLIDEVLADQGITNAIRRVLGETKLPLSAPEIKSGVVNLGVDLSQYVNAAAVIHNTLTRLEKQGEVMRVVNPVGQTAAYALIKKNNAFYGEP
jgi:hypothetical protein